MEVKLILGPDRVENLKKHLGDDRITVLGKSDEDGYLTVSFEINSSWDVLCVLHAGVDSGLTLGAYGQSRKPQAA